jgi:hypothetical protein
VSEWEQAISDENYAKYLILVEEKGCPAAGEFYNSVMDHAAMERNIAKRDARKS